MRFSRFKMFSFYLKAILCNFIYVFTVFFVYLTKITELKFLNGSVHVYFQVVNINSEENVGGAWPMPMFEWFLLHKAKRAQNPGY